MGIINSVKGTKMQWWRSIISTRALIFMIGYLLCVTYLLPSHYIHVIFPSASRTESKPASREPTLTRKYVPRGDYVINTPGCKIMEMDPFHASIKSFLKQSKIQKCPLVFSRLENKILTINAKKLNNWGMVNPSCCYRSIHRVTQSLAKYNNTADSGYRYSSDCHKIKIGSHGAKVNDAYVKVECRGVGKMNHTVDFHGTPLSPMDMSQESRRKAEYWDARKKMGLLNPPSVLLVGIDSVSRMNMIRSLQRTREFLQRNDFIEMKGYTKVGHNTFPNMMAALGGMEQDNYSSCWPNTYSKLDNCPFIWKDFSSLNYITASLEDAPGIGTFNYGKSGFVLPPADYYLRPFTVAIHKHYGGCNACGRAMCVGGISPTHFQMKFMKKFVVNMGHDYPYFLFSWFNSISHNDLNGVKSVDGLFRDFFSDMTNSSITNPNNTIMVFMSDHGFRFGKIRETFPGFYEDNLPFFFIRLPPSLKGYYSEWDMNLRRNSRQLTSPLDLHSTFKNVVSIANSTLSNKHDNEIDASRSAKLKPTYKPRYSLFEYIPSNRTCESASIPQRYCMCGVTPAVSKSSDISSQLGKVVVSKVNEMLQPVSRNCATLNFSKVLYGREIGKGEKWDNFHRFVKYTNYLLALEVKPGKAHFEAKIRKWGNGTANILGDITRTNSYKGQSDCVSSFIYKPYCMCKNLLNRKSRKHTVKSHNPKHRSDYYTKKTTFKPNNHHQTLFKKGWATANSTLETLYNSSFINSTILNFLINLLH